MTQVKKLKRGSIVSCDFVGKEMRAALSGGAIVSARFPLLGLLRIALPLGATGAFLLSPSHSGICLSETEIVSLDSDFVSRKACVKREHPDNFRPSSLPGGIHLVRAREIEVACIDKEIISLPWAAEYAEKMIGKNYVYDLRKNNCHKFVCACVRGDFTGKYEMSGEYGKDRLFPWLRRDVDKEIMEAHSCRGKIKWRVLGR